MFKVVYTKQAKKDAKKVVASGLKKQVEELLEILKLDPTQDPPPFKKLVGDMKVAISRRINIQHRLVYQIIDEEKTVKVIRMWTHYE